MLNYNGLKYLKRTIPQILKLNYPNYEFIIVDNGSIDGSIEFIKNFKKINLIKSPELRKKNFACNYAIKRAMGEYILLLDNDALIVDKNLIKNLIKQHNSLHNMGAISLAFYMDEFSKKTDQYGGFLGYNFMKYKKSLTGNLIKTFHNYDIAFPTGFGLFIKKERWELVGGYDEYLNFGGDDSDLGIKLILWGYKNRLYSKTLQIHIGMPERQDNKKYTLKWKEVFYSSLYTITKNYSFLNMSITLILYSLYAFPKSIKQSIFRFHLGPFFAFFRGYYLFLKNLSHALKERKKIQSKRKIKKDIFLKIKPPKFD